jgi:hypothetical protein
MASPPALERSEPSRNLLDDQPPLFSIERAAFACHAEPLAFGQRIDAVGATVSCGDMRGLGALQVEVAAVMVGDQRNSASQTQSCVDDDDGVTRSSEMQPSGAFRIVRQRPPLSQFGRACFSGWKGRYLSPSGAPFSLQPELDRAAGLAWA